MIFRALKDFFRISTVDSHLLAPLIYLSLLPLCSLPALGSPETAQKIDTPPTLSLAQLAHTNHCSLAIRKNAGQDFPVYYCFRNEHDAQGGHHCSLRQMDISEGVKPYFGIPGVQSVDDVIQTDTSCEKGGVAILFQMQVDPDRLALDWLAHSPLAGGDVEVVATNRALVASTYSAMMKNAAIKATKASAGFEGSKSVQHANLDPSNQPYVTVPVFFGTDRNYVKGQNPELTFQGLRSDGPLQAGIAQVTIPKLKRPALSDLDIFKISRNSVDLSKQISVSAISVLSADQFYGAMNARVKSSAEKDLFVYIHGYNVSFAEGLRSTAQLAYDLNFKGAAVLYSWPAGTLTTYPMAENNVEWTNRHLAYFLKDVFFRSGAKNIYLVAHSMGNRATVNALDQLASFHALPTNAFQQIVLAAPDIDNGYFRDREQNVRSLTTRLTVYASEGDFALKASRKIHEYPRLGDGVSAEKICGDMDSIDANKIVTGFPAHSYITENEEVVNDLRGLLAGRPINQRPHLQSVGTSAGTFWNLMP